MGPTSDGTGDERVDPALIRARSADLYVNTLCNFGCATCFLGDEYFSRDITLSVAAASAIGSWLSRAGVHDVAVLGGEPTLHPELPDLMRALRRTGIEQLRLITNGTPRARRLLAGPLDGLVDVVYVSLDGATPATNDELRGAGTFRHALAAIELLRQREIPFVITATLGRAAVDELDELLELAETSGCRTLNVHWLSPVGRARHRNLVVAPSRWHEVVAAIAAYVPERKDLTIECQVGTLPSDGTWRSAVDPSACAVRDNANLQFMPDGNVFACGLLVDTPALAGYRWDGTDLLVRAGATERKLCMEFDGCGCPARIALMGETVDTALPVCIYERVVRSA